MMKTENKEQLVKDFYTFWDNGEKEIFKRVVSVDLKDHDRSPMAEGTDYEAILNLRQAFNGLSDMKHNLVQVHYLGNDRIVVRWEATAVHTGEVLGFKATNKTVCFAGHDILQLKQGKIAEMWHIEQLQQVTHQLSL